MTLYFAGMNSSNFLASQIAVFSQIALHKRSRKKPCAPGPAKVRFSCWPSLQAGHLRAWDFRKNGVVWLVFRPTNGTWQPRNAMLNRSKPWAVCQFSAPTMGAWQKMLIWIAKNGLWGRPQRKLWSFGEFAANIGQLQNILPHKKDCEQWENQKFDWHAGVAASVMVQHRQKWLIFHIHGPCWYFQKWGSPKNWVLS